MNQTNKTKPALNVPTINLTQSERESFVRTVKAGYFRELYHRGLITGTQLELLMLRQNKSLNQPKPL